MSDPTEQTSEEEVVSTDPEAEAQGETSPETPPPWGDDFSPERAWSTILKQRDRERELESEAKAYKRLREDPEAQREFLAELGFELPEDDEDLEVDDDPVAPVRSKLEELEQWKAQQEQEKAVALFKSDVDSLAKEHDLQLKDRDYTRIWRDAEDLAVSTKKPFDKALVQQVFKDMLEERDALRKQAIEEYTGSKKTAHVPPSSKSATNVPDLDDQKARHEYLRERARQLAEGQ